MASEIAQSFAQGMSIANSFEDSRQRSKALDAAITQYGDAARAPGLFTALQQLETGKSQESRAQAQEGRAQQTFNTGMQQNQQGQQQQAILGMVNGLRAERDSGGDVGQAFDKFQKSGLFRQLGVAEEDLPAMRQAIVDDPAILDSYLASLRGVIAGPEGAGGAGSLTATQQASAEANATSRSNVSGLVAKGLEAVDALDTAGAARTSNPSSFLDRASRGTRSSVVGRYLGDLAGTEASGIRQTLSGVRSGLLAALAGNEGMSGRMFDSDAEKELWMTMIGNDSFTVEAQRDLLTSFNESWGNGGTPLNVTGAQRAQLGVQAAPRVIQLYPGFVNPKTGATFNGGAWDDPANWTSP